MRLVMLVTAVLLLLMVPAASAVSSVDSVDTYVAEVTIMAGTSSFNTSAPRSGTPLSSVSTALCSYLTALLPTNVPARNWSSSCFVTYDATPQVVLHVQVATATTAASYLVWSVLDSWNTTSGTSMAAATASIAQQLFIYFGVSAGQTRFVSSILTIPCRSTATFSTPTPAPTLAPIVCSEDTSVVPRPQSVVLMTKSNSVMASSLLSAICDAVSSVSCAGVTVQDLNVEVDTTALDGSSLTLYAATIVFPATAVNRTSALLSLINSVRTGSPTSVGSLAVQRLYLVPPAGSTATQTLVKVYSIDESFSSAYSVVMTCNSFYDLWVCFLLIFVPIGYIVFRQAYHAGKKKGIRLEKELIKLEEDRQQQQHEQVQQDFHDISTAAMGAVGGSNDGGAAGAASSRSWSQHHQGNITEQQLQQQWAAWAQQQLQQYPAPPTAVGGTASMDAAGTQEYMAALQASVAAQQQSQLRS